MPTIFLATPCRSTPVPSWAPSALGAPRRLVGARQGGEDGPGGFEVPARRWLPVDAFVFNVFIQWMETFKDTR